jgi:hypothetical protein
MRNVTGLGCGTIAGLALLLWSSAGIAQSTVASTVTPANVATAPRPSSNASSLTPPLAITATRSVICDSAGKTCVAAALPPLVASPVPTPPLHPAQSPAVVGEKLICDASGKICARTLIASPNPKDHNGSLPDKPTAIVPSVQVAAIVARPSAQPSAVSTAAASRAPSAKALESKDFNDAAHVDGALVQGQTATTISDDPFDWVVHVSKSRHLLQVFFKGRPYRVYHAVFGRSLEQGAKLWEGDRRTPEGNYLIVAKHRSPRFGWFLKINYPNEFDQQRFEQSQAAHIVPASAGEGGQIGIHGTDAPYLNVADVNWTTGCISVDNADIKELARLLPIGTLVVINP